MLIIFLGVDVVPNVTKLKAGANLFKDFQVLGRIWSHPWCLRLSHISRENKVRENTVISFF